MTSRAASPPPDRMPRSRRLAHGRRGPPAVALLMALAGVAVGARAQPAKAPVSLEYAVKATYLYKLAPFVNWPPQEFASADAPFRICVVGGDPFNGYLQQQVAGRRVGAHPLQVERLESLTAGSRCQIAFISGSLPQGVPSTLAAVDGQPVLTVLDSTTHDPGGIVRFVIDHGRVRFAIDAGAAARSHLEISSKLLDLAVAVEGDG